MGLSRALGEDHEEIHPNSKKERKKAEHPIYYFFLFPLGLFFGDGGRESIEPSSLTRCVWHNGGTLE